MKQKVFIRNVGPICEGVNKNNEPYRRLDVVVCWREVMANGYIQDHEQSVSLRGESLNQFEALGYKIGDEVVMDLAFYCFKGTNGDRYFNSVTGTLIDEI